MSQLIETRWKRFGHDRVYVNDADGNEIGHVDLKSRTVAATVPGYESTLEECLRRWSADHSGQMPTKDAASVPPVGLPPPIPPHVATPASAETQNDHAASPLPAPTVGSEVPTTASRPEPTDLAANVAGAAARAERDRINSQAPIRNLLARLLGVKTDERSWRVGAKGEVKVGRQLAKLGPGWHVLHAVPVGEKGSDIDHVVIGPPGVITINTKCHPRGNAWVCGRAVMVNGKKTAYLPKSRSESERTTTLLSAACGKPVDVRAAIVFVELEDLKIKEMPTDVHVASHRRVVEWLHSLPSTTAPADVEEIFARARISTTWRTA